jgi:hypothetical protein
MKHLLGFWEFEVLISKGAAEAWSLLANFCGVFIYPYLEFIE